MEQDNFNSEFVLERLFIGFIEELSSNSTIDSYRAKSSSPRSVLRELYQVLGDWKNKKIKSPETVAIIKEEVADLIENDVHLKYGKISKSFFIDLLKELKCEENSQANSDTVQNVEYNLYYLLTINKDYHVVLINNIEDIIMQNYADEKQFVLAQKSLNNSCSLLISELLNSGYSKRYIRAYMKRNFFKTHTGNFQKRWEKFKLNFSFEHENKYIVIFKLFVNIDKILEVDFGQIKEDIATIQYKYKLDSTDQFKSFLNKGNLEYFIPIEASAFRFFSSDKQRKKKSNYNIRHNTSYIP